MSKRDEVTIVNYDRENGEIDFEFKIAGGTADMIEQVAEKLNITPGEFMAQAINIFTEKFADRLSSDPDENAELINDFAKDFAKIMSSEKDDPEPEND